MSGLSWAAIIPLIAQAGAQLDPHSNLFAALRHPSLITSHSTPHQITRRLKNPGWILRVAQRLLIRVWYVMYMYIHLYRAVSLQLLLPIFEAWENPRTLTWLTLSRQATDSLPRAIPKN